MTVGQLKKMIKGLDDDEKIKFVASYHEDRNYGSGRKVEYFVPGVKAITSHKGKIVTNARGNKVAVDFRD